MSGTIARGRGTRLPASRTRDGVAARVDEPCADEPYADELRADAPCVDELRADDSRNDDVRSGPVRPEPAPPRAVDPGAVASGAVDPEAIHPALRCMRAMLPAAILASATRRAAALRTCPLRELVVSGWVGERTLYAALARDLGLPFSVAGDVLPLWEAGHAPPPGVSTLRCLGTDGAVSVRTAPDAEAFVRLAARGGPAGLVVTTPGWIEAQVARARADEARRDAVHALGEAAPLASARATVTGAQGFAAAAALALVAASAWSHPGGTLLAVQALATLVFLACLGLRLLAAREARPPRRRRLPRLSARELPTYSVLVALYREAEVVPQLIDALEALRWPRAKLDIRLVCEADDEATLAALRRRRPPPHMRVVTVPPCQPRTKPKALNFALDAARGTLLVLYDAEDRPHPDQLLEAYARFRDGPDALACLQAPLQIDNGRDGFLARGFALEYAALFRGLLPWIARRGLPLPLGGTSNHFRTEALRRVGAWDPYNVTEDADLGFRLARAGYRTGVLTRPTLEAAPRDLRTWLPQRTRWLKGWMQTGLVQLRRPLGGARALGWRGVVVTQLLTLGTVGSILLHPVMLLGLPWLAVLLAAGIAPGGLALAVLALGIVNVVLGYGAFYALAASVLGRRERWLARGAWWRLPLYWGALSLAGWRALIQLVREPHRWEKTPHAPSATRAPPPRHPRA